MKPKKMVKGERYFEGEIWVDDRDFQIVKTYGKGVGIIKKSKDNQFPKFETYREQIDGKYWFPTYTHADERCISGIVAAHPHDGEVPNYKRFGADTTIKFGDEVTDTKK